MRAVPRDVALVEVTQFCVTCRVLIVARLEVLDLRRDDCSLIGAEVPALEIRADDEGQRIGAVELSELRLDAGKSAGAIAIATVKDHPLEKSLIGSRNPCSRISSAGIRPHLTTSREVYTHSDVCRFT
jgi:hypothetical protein